MYKIIDLDIDDNLSADTKVDAVALVEMPAIETEFIYFNNQKFEEQTYRATDEISKIACRARKFKDENPNKKCGTNVGWTRSSQLCQKKPLTLDTVKRMYSYLSRHKIDLASSKSYEDGCGKLMYDAWGGVPALAWSKRILQRAEGEFDINVDNLPDYVNYDTGKTLVEDVAFIEKKPYEKKEDYISRCIEWHIKNKGWDRDQAAAVCYKQAEEDFNCGCGQYAEDIEGACWEGYEPIGVKELDGQTVPNCVPVENSKFEEIDLDVFGYQTKHFDMCPGAVKTFTDLIALPMSTDVLGMVRSAAQIADNIFKIEKEVLEAQVATQEQYNEANVLLDDFYDLIDEIDRLLGKKHNVDYMDGHLEVIGSYLTSSEFFSSHEYTDEELQVKAHLEFLKHTDKQMFEAVVEELLRGYTKEDIIRMNHKRATIYFQYYPIADAAGDTRDFCASIENRYFRRLQIDLLRDKNIEFGHQRQPYSKWLFKGGPNCVHGWRKYLAQEAVLADMGMVEGRPGIAPRNMPNNGYYNAETKKKSERAYAISQSYGSVDTDKNRRTFDFKSDDEKRMLYSPLMVPNILIPRIDEKGEKYFVRFTKDAVERIQRKFMIEQRLRDTNLEHNNKVSFSDMVMVESWLVNGKSDKAFTLGYNFNEIPEGTWMVGYKILDTPQGDIIWNDFIKTGKVKGLSAEGAFLMNFSRDKMDEYLLEEIINILNQIN